jgi:hypothetical protein
MAVPGTLSFVVEADRSSDYDRRSSANRFPEPNGGSGDSMKRLVDVLLIVVLAVGGVLAWNASRERSRLEAEYRGLRLATGELPISDPAKAHILALETGEPLHFAWRIYLPPNYQVIRRDNLGSSGTSSSSQSVEFIARVRIREDGKGGLEIYQSFSGGSSRGGFADRTLAELLRGREGTLIAEQLGAKEVATLGPDEPATLLRLSLPGEMEAEERAKLSPYLFEKDLFPVIFELKLGPDAPKLKASPGK